jgi:hypothetical protein
MIGGAVVEGQFYANKRFERATLRLHRPDGFAGP